MSLKPKVGDKVYCTQNVYNLDNIIVIKEGDLCSIYFLHKKNFIDCLVSVSHEDVYYTFNLDNIVRRNYYDYFVNVKEYRKRKLENLFKECH